MRLRHLMRRCMLSGNLSPWGSNKPDRCVLTKFEEKIKFKDGHYKVSLPWKDVHLPLQENYQLALKRLRGLCSTTCSSNYSLHFGGSMMRSSKIRLSKGLLRWSWSRCLQTAEQFTICHTTPWCGRTKQQQRYELSTMHQQGQQASP